MAAIPPFHVPMNFQPPQHIWHPGPADVSPEPPLKEGAVTLLIRHLPEAIPHDTLSRLFSHYGASSVRPCTGGKMRNSAFVDFKNEALASQAHHQLNGLRFLGKVLTVERTNNKQSQSGKNEGSINVKDATPITDFDQGSKLGLFPKNEPISEKLGIEYPFPPHLEYAYPPPDGNILTNIVNALIAVPRFYTQVLHLMNKMNIPAPFRMALPTPPLPPTAVVPSPPAPPPPPPPQVDPQPPASELSSGESELESSDEELGETRRKKRVKREVIVGPAVDKGVVHESVGLKQASLVPKEIPLIKKKNPVLQIKIVPKQVQSKKVEAHVVEELIETDEEKLDLKPFATTEELENGKLPPEEILSLPMFKNYSAGNPAPVLYIKNLAKDVIMDDFYFIFGSIFGDIDTAKASLNIKLMQEGRMRGQAFVTFSSIELAHRALNLANGYVFKGKPMIIQFGRNPSAVKAS